MGFLNFIPSSVLSNLGAVITLDLKQLSKKPWTFDPWDFIAQFFATIADIITTNIFFSFTSKNSQI